MIPHLGESTPRHPEHVEHEMIGLAGIVGLLLLIFAAGYLIVYPNHATQGYSSLYWNQPPQASIENGKTVIVFSAVLESHELSVSEYTMKAYIDTKLAATKVVDLNANQKETITFTLSIGDELSGKREIKVTAQKIADSNAEKFGPVLVITDWVDLDNV